ncbi:MAG: BlaI/MecI/CopY family transcriptional regulator [Planctomycetes bacterium]|nr:BlaI/MecI/CopY family transcriptional regulator [Planctomycetota bacterium]
MAPRESDLGTAELEVLKALWDHGPATVRQVLERLHDQGRRVAYTTVLTFLSRLEQKRFVTSDKSDQAYVYRPVVSRQKVTATRLRSVIEQLYDGVAAPMVLQLMRQENFSADEIAEFQNLIDQLDAKRQRSKR